MEDLLALEDVQSRHDERAVPLDSVGVSDIAYPIIVLDRDRGQQRTVAQVAMAVNLSATVKGTHLSRFMEVLNHFRGEMTYHTIPALLRELQDRLGAQSARVEVRFPYFLERQAPVSGASGLMDYRCSFVGEMSDGPLDFILGVRVPVTSLCPCSKAISDYGAHNQRGEIDIEVRTGRTSSGEPQFLWIEDLVEIAEASGSAPVLPVLKRADERHVTMRAYDNPVFVEDMVRNVAVRLRDDVRVTWFRIQVRNFESIHNHSAFAATCWTRG